MRKNKILKLELRLNTKEKKKYQETKRSKLRILYLFLIKMDNERNSCNVETPTMERSLDDHLFNLWN